MCIRDSSNVLKCTIQFAYDRFFTTFNNTDIQKQVINQPDGVVNSNDIKNTVPDGSFGIGSRSTDNLNSRYAQDGNNALNTGSLNQKTRKKNKRGSGAR